MKEKRPRKNYDELLKEFFCLGFFEKMQILLNLLTAIYTFYAESTKKRKALVAENAKVLKMLKTNNVGLAFEEFENGFNARLQTAKEKGLEMFIQQITQTEGVIFAAFLHQVFIDEDLDLSSFLKFLERFQKKSTLGDFISYTGWWSKVAATFLVDIEQYDERDVTNLVERQWREHRGLIEHFIALRKPDLGFKLLEGTIEK